MQALKGLVITLGILIVFSMILLAYGFYTKLTDPEFSPLKKTKKEDILPAPAAKIDLRLGFAAECSIVDMRPDGNRLYVRGGPPGSCEKIVIVDLATGAVVGTVVP